MPTCLPVAYLKKLVQNIYPPETFSQDIRFICNGGEWKDGQILSDYRLEDGIVVAALNRLVPDNSPSNSMAMEEEPVVQKDDLWSSSELGELVEMLKLPLEYSEKVNLVLVLYENFAYIPRFGTC